MSTLWTQIAIRGLDARAREGCLAVVLNLMAELASEKHSNTAGSKGHTHLEM